jgi:hypothetical protein
MEIKMNKLYIFCVAALAVIATGCSSKKDIAMDLHDGQGLEFVHFEKAADSWLVTADDESYSYDVVVAHTYTHDEAVTYTISVGDKTTGVEGTDFVIPTKSVTIAKGEYIGKFPVSILYDTTGEGFVLELVLSVDKELVNPSYGASSTVTVKSDKITIDWEWMLGNWNASDASGGDPYVMAVSKKDETTAVFTNIWGTGGDIEGTVDFENRIVTFHGPFLFGDLYEVGGDLAVGSTSDDGIFYAKMSPLGIVISGIHYFIIGGSYDGYELGEDATTMTR